MQVNIKVSNLKKALSQLKTLSKDLEPDFQEVVKGGAQLIRGEAIKSIQSGAKSGIVYEKEGSGKPPPSNMFMLRVNRRCPTDRTHRMNNAHGLCTGC